MANAREIKSRISSVQDTMKITNAMYMISSSKMKKAKKILSDTEPYFYNMQSAIARILRHIPDTQHPFFSVRHLIPTEERKIATIVVTGDKGMAGAYNHNITKMTEEFMANTPGHHKLYVLGVVGRQYFSKKNVDMDGSFRYTVQKPTMHRARIISEEVIRSFLDREVEEIEMFPSAEGVLDIMIPNYLTGVIYGCLVEAYASENNARMTAMQSSTDSAKKMLQDLSIQYNRARQAAITQEITEVCSGAKAQKRKGR